MLWLSVDASRDYARARGIPEVIVVAREDGEGGVLRMRGPSYEAKEAMTWP